MNIASVPCNAVRLRNHVETPNTDRSSSNSSNPDFNSPEYTPISCAYFISRRAKTPEMTGLRGYASDAFDHTPYPRPLVCSIYTKSSRTSNVYYKKDDFLINDDNTRYQGTYMRVTRAKLRMAECVAREIFAVFGSTPALAPWMYYTTSRISFCTLRAHHVLTYSKLIARSAGQADARGTRRTLRPARRTGTALYHRPCVVDSNLLPSRRVYTDGNRPKVDTTRKEGRRQGHLTGFESAQS